MHKKLQKVNTILHLKSLVRRPKTAAIILAGGSGRRMGLDVPKQMLLLDDVPVLIHAVRAFDACRSIDEIVIVTRAEDRIATEMMCQNYAIRKLVRVVEGGATRAESAANGFCAVSAKMKYVAIHDAARCLITPAQIKEVATAAYAYHAATAASPVTDSIKVINRYGMIERDLPREELWAAGTPQIFDRVYYAAALKKAEESGVAFTDDNALMELIGQRVKVVDVGADNFKITYETDVARAESVLRRRKERT